MREPLIPILSIAKFLSNSQPIAPHPTINRLTSSNLPASSLPKRAAIPGRRRVDS